MGPTDPSGDYVYAMDRVGQGMRARGLGSFPSRLRDTRGALWDRPYGRSVNYYLRRPRTGTMLREFMNSEAVDWGAVRSNTPQRSANWESRKAKSSTTAFSAGTSTRTSKPTA